MRPGSTLGRMWRRSTAGAGAPRARAAPTYSVSRRASTEPRTMRVTAGTPQRPTASGVVRREPGRERGRERQEGDERQAGEGEAVRAEAPPGLAHAQP